MTAELFEHWMIHFIKHTNPTNLSPILLIKDNYESHISFARIKLVKENNIILLTLPTHTSHRFQPLDKGVFGPLKKYYSHDCQKWLLKNSGKKITIYHIADILKDAYPLAFCPKNVVSAFKATGVFPFNDDIFNDNDFMVATVTDMPNVVREEQEPSKLNSNEIAVIDVQFRSTSSCQDKTTGTNQKHPSEVTPAKKKISCERVATSKKTTANRFISPVLLQPYPKTTSMPLKKTKTEEDDGSSD